MTTSGGTPTSSHGSPSSCRTSAVRSVAEGLLGLLFPHRCLVCQDPCLGLAPLCPRCESELPGLEGARCLRCEEPLRDVGLDLCRPCGTQDRGFDAARSLGPYDSGWGLLVRALKFERERAIARFLSRRLADYLVETRPFGAIDVATYVPMSLADRRRRGFNQARLLAEGVGRRLGLPVEPLLAKGRRTLPQAGLPAAERQENLRGAFRLVRSPRTRALLVDDIFTTGSTAAECAHVLKRGQCERVFVLTVARA